MSFEDILRNPLFYSSPSPFSIAFHGIVILLCAYSMRRRIFYKKHPLLNSLTDSFFLVGFIVLSGDLIWINISGIRFLAEYPDNLFLVLSVAGRDIVGMIFCYLLTQRYFGWILKFKKSTVLAYTVLIFFIGVNFAFAVDPTWTDWTYAIRQNCSTDYILKAFLVNWVGGKIIGGGLIYTWFKR